MPNLANNKECTGCAACFNVCQKSAITMLEDAEGFLLPRVHTTRCVECGMCEKRCPAIHPLTSETKEQKAYAVINSIDRKQSSSGGAFSLFARYVLERDGIVFGAAMNDNLHVSHIKVDRVEDLNRLRGSKYVQSAIGRIYQDVKQELNVGRLVLFSGTPCQVAGLYAFLGKRYEENLMTLDLVCHGVPNQKTFDTYLRKLKNSNRLSMGDGNVERIRFRKLDSWSIVPSVKFSKTKWQMLEQEDNAYMGAFFKGLTYRESCFRCPYANLKRMGNFTIADFWGIGRHGKPFKKDVSSGISLVLDNCGRMITLIDELQKHAYIEERDIKEAVAENGNLKHPLERPESRDSAVKDLLDEKITLLDYSGKYGLLKKENLKYYVSKCLRSLIYALRLYNVYKRISYKLGK